MIYILKYIDSNINLDCLKYIKETDLKDIFGSDIGARVTFRALVNEWRISNVKYLKYKVKIRKVFK